MSVRKIIVAAAFAVLAACAQTVATQAVDSPDLTNCAARGGVVDTVGRLQRTVCRVPYADAGKTCSDKSDCAARCILDREAGDAEAASGPVQGKCQQHQTQFGCFSEVDGGKVISTICVD